MIHDSLKMDRASMMHEWRLDSSIIADRLDMVINNASLQVSDGLVPNDVNVCSYNACSLSVPGAVKSLTAQMYAKCIHIGCVQETRGTYKGVRKAGSFWRASSPAENGSYGVDIFICHSRPFATNKRQAIYVCKEDVTIVYCDPRRIFVVCNVGRSLQLLHGMGRVLDRMCA